jgi:hypothetical protein
MRSRTTAIGALILGFTFANTAVAHGQVLTTLDLGGATVRYGDSVRVTATSLTPRIRFDDGPLAGAVVGTISSLGENGWTAQGSLDFSVLSGAVGPARFEIAAEAGGSLHDDATRTGQYLGRARLHIGGGTRGVWAGAAAGKTWDASMWHPVVQGDFGGWVRVGRMQLVASVTPASIGDSLRYTDGQGALRWDAGRVELAAGLGVRSGDAIVRESSTRWGSASATFWLARHVGLVAAGGTYPVDFTQGYPGGRYLSVAVRLGTRPMTVALRPSGDPAPSALRSTATGPRLEIASLPNGRRTIRVQAPAARTVEVMGDFTTWQPLALSRVADGWWTATLAVAPGTYQLNVRLNGGTWEAPAGVPEKLDEFGTRVGILTLR